MNSLDIFSGTALVLMTIIITVQVFGRYVLNASPVWAEQAALLILIWCVFMAAAAGMREGFHIRISVMVDRLPNSFERAKQFDFKRRSSFLWPRHDRFWHRARLSNMASHHSNLRHSPRVRLHSDFDLRIVDYAVFD